jgi:hypothetical protein
LTSGVGGGGGGSSLVPAGGWMAVTETSERVVITPAPGAPLRQRERCAGRKSGSFDDVVVARGARCVLTSSVVRGDVTVRPGGRLSSSDNQIEGDITARRPRWLASTGDLIGGEVSIAGATGPGVSSIGLSVNVSICGTTLPRGDIFVSTSSRGTVAIGSPPVCAGNNVQGRIYVRRNVVPAGQHLFVSRNVVGGQLNVSDNRGRGRKTVIDNTAGRIDCRRNTRPLVGGPNLSATTSGQCS